MAVATLPNGPGVAVSPAEVCAIRKEGTCVSGFRHRGVGSSDVANDALASRCRRIRCRQVPPLIARWVGAPATAVTRTCRS